MGEMTRQKIFETAMDATRAQARLRLLAVSAVTPTLLHELMQPLAAAVNHLGVASRQVAQQSCPTAAADAVARSEAAVTRAVEIVRRMRAFVLEGHVRSEPIGLGGIVRKVRSELPTEQLCDLRVTLALEEGADHVWADPLLIELVIRNLLVNAIEAAAATAGPAAVAIGARRFRDMVIVAVEDGGPGLTEEAYAKLFEPMFTTKPRGCGLGLALCRTIVETHGGQLWAAEPGAGPTTFYLSLPAPPAGTDKSN